jgi:hypothetical protein
MPPTSAPSDQPLRYDGSAEERIEQLLRVLPAVRSVWFPTLKELRIWRLSGLGLYVRRVGPAQVEVGPRVPSMWAACFSPVDVLTFRDGSLSWSRRFPRFTIGLLGVWWVVIAGWGVQGIPQVIRGEQPLAWLLFFGLLAGAAIVGPIVGWRFGGDHLDQFRQQLVGALRVEDSGEDW